MFKKLAITGASAALVLGMAIPAFAKPPCHSNCGSADTSNYAFVTNSVGTYANTGSNGISGFVVKSGTIYTDTANSKSLVGNLVNTNVGTSNDVSNHAFVSTVVTTNANTGDNGISGGFVGGGYISTGQANAGTSVVNVVNTNLSFHR